MRSSIKNVRTSGSVSNLMHKLKTRIKVNRIKIKQLILETKISIKFKGESLLFPTYPKYV